MLCIWLLASVLFVSKSNKNNSQFLQPPYFVEPFLLPHLPPKEQNFSASVFLVYLAIIIINKYGIF